MRPALEVAEFSADITSDQPIVAERAMYFDTNGRGGGSCAPPVGDLNQKWYFAEGYTGGNFDTWVLVMNADAEKTAKAYANGKLFVADTNNHLIRTIDLKRGNKVATLTIAGLEPPALPKPQSKP